MSIYQRLSSNSNQFVRTSILSNKSARTMSTMKKFDINSTIRMPSGYELPLLGYGVSTE